MAIVYVDSAAAGTNNGTSWTNAYTSIVSALTSIAAGTEIRISHTHDQTFTAATTLAFGVEHQANPPFVISTDKNTDLYAYGARLNLENGSSLYILSINESVRFYGVHFRNAHGRINFGNNNNPMSQQFYNCRFTCFLASSGDLADHAMGGSGSCGALIKQINCEYDASAKAASAYRIMPRSGYCEIVSPSFIGGTYMSVRKTLANPASKVVFRHADLSATVGDLVSISGATTPFVETVFENCNLPASPTFTFSQPGSTASAVHSGNGTITLPQLFKQWNYFGSVISRTSHFRTGGADDGEQVNAYSLDMTTNANAKELYNPLEITLGSRWVGPKSVISAATAKGIYTSTRAAPLATPANLTTDTSDWTGAGTGTKQKIDHTLSNASTLTVYVASGVTLQNDEFWIEVSEPDQVAGLVKVKAFLAKPSTTVYVDPKIAVA